MRSFRHCTTAAMPAGVMTLGGVGGAMAGVAGGAAPDASTGATYAGAGAQPNASVSRTGVAQERATRPNVAVTRLARGTAAPRQQAPQAVVARHEGERRTTAVVHRTTAVARRATAHGTLHAMHPGPETGGRQS